MALSLNNVSEAFIGALLLAQAGISPNNDRQSWTEDEQYNISSVKIDVNGIYVTNYGECIYLKAVDMSTV